MSERFRKLKHQSAHTLAGLLMVIPGMIHESPVVPPPPIPMTGAAPVEDFSVYLPLVSTECSPGRLGPNDITNLNIWKLTLPVDRDNNNIADEVLQPELCSFMDPEHFVAGTDEAGSFIRLTIKKDDEDTTDDSDYPRDEFREMQNGGLIPAGWKSGEGRHSMTSRMKIVELARSADGKKIDTSVYQIHGIKDDIQIRAKREEGKINIVAHYNNANGQKVNFPLILDYHEGTVFDAGFIVENNIITIEVNGVQHQIPANPEDTYYFKAGIYQNGDATEGETAANLYKLNIQHQ